MKKIVLTLLNFLFICSCCLTSCSEEEIPNNTEPDNSNPKDSIVVPEPEITDTISLTNIVQAVYQQINTEQASYSLSAASVEATYNENDKNLSLSNPGWGASITIVAQPAGDTNNILLPEGLYNEKVAEEKTFLDKNTSSVIFMNDKKESIQCPIHKSVSVTANNALTTCYIETMLNESTVVLAISGDIKFSTKEEAHEKPEEVLEFKYVPVAYFDNSNGQNTNYYFTATTVPSSYDKEQNDIILEENGYTIVLDFYGDSTEGKIQLPEGNYMPASTFVSFTYNPEYSMFRSQNSGDNFMAAVNTPVQVSYDGNNMLIEVVIETERKNYRCKFNGEVKFSDPNQGTGNSLPQIGHDIVTTFTGSFGSYRGNLFLSDTGNMVINLYDGEFDHETGGQTGAGYCVSLCLFNTLFNNPADAVVKPGEYLLDHNFKKFTWYPGIEVDYMGVTMVLGSFCQQHKEDGTFAYSYITEGNINVTEGEPGIFTVTVDAKTADGFLVKGSYTGEIPVVDQSEDKPKAVISTLKDDYTLNLSQIEVARLYKQADINNCGRFVLDLGSPSGLDQCIIDNGGDIFRIDLLTEIGTTVLPEGTYNVMEEKYDTYYKPFKLVKGHFENGGDLCGTRWFHFAEGRFLVADGLAPAMEGSISITKIENGNYNIKIQVLDDAGYHITGEWNGPIIDTNSSEVPAAKAIQKKSSSLKKAPITSKCYLPLCQQPVKNLKIK